VARANTFRVILDESGIDRMTLEDGYGRSTPHFGVRVAATGKGRWRLGR
jgi:hypothetical protein